MLRCSGYCPAFICICAAIYFVLCQTSIFGDSNKWFFQGTYFVFRKADQTIIVAIDSRISRTERPKDDYCKIVVLGPRMFAFASGVDAIGSNDNIIVDIRDVFRRVPIEPDLVSIAKNVVLAFAGDIKQQKKSITGARSKEVTDVFIAGEVAQTLPDIAHGHLDIGPEITPSAEAIADLSQPQHISGHLDLYEEFFNLATERARTLNEQILGRLGNTSQVDRQAALLTGIVQGIINWGNDPKIGGEVATIILEHGSDLRWYSRPSFCREK
jgi:hypothetical protein